MNGLTRTVGILLFALLTSCASTMRTVPTAEIPGEILHKSPPKKAMALWEQASALEAQQRYLDAINVYREIAAQYPDNAIAPQALHRAGRILAHREQWNDALAFYTYVAKNYPQWRGIPELFLDMTLAYLMLGNGQEALKAASSAAPKPEKTLYTGLAHALNDQEDKALSAVERYLEDPYVISHPDSLVEASELAAKILPQQTVREYLKRSSTENLRIFFHCTAALQELSLGQVEQGRKRLQYLRETTPPDNTMSQLIERLLSSIAAKEISSRLDKADPGKIGILVPLQGDFAIYGRSILRGAFLALNKWNVRHPADPVELIVYDSSPYENSPEEPVSRLLREEKVLALVGPIGRKAVDRLIEKGYTGSVLVASLIPDEPDGKTTAFYLRMLPGVTESINLMVRYAVENLGIRSFGALYPTDNFGQKALDAFRNAVESYGGKMVSAVPYPPRSVDFEVYIKTLKEQSGNRADREVNSAMEALFLPDTIHVVSIIAPQLFYYGITGIPYLGSHLWDHSNLPDLANGYLEGSYYVTSFSGFIEDSSVQEFISDFRSNFGTNPELLHAVGYDAVNLILQIRGSLSSSERTRMEMISRAHGFIPEHTITGITRIENDGHLDRNYRILTITNNIPREVLP